MNNDIFISRYNLNYNRGNMKKLIPCLLVVVLISIGSIGITSAFNDDISNLTTPQQIAAGRYIGKVTIYNTNNTENSYESQITVVK